MEKNRWTDRVKNEYLCNKDKRAFLHTTKRMEADWIGHILRRNCLLKPVIEGKIGERTEVTEI
jgi:hypothetical protein